MLGQQIISGLATGSLYALTAIAVVVVFRNTRTINVAQGDFSMLAAFFAVLFLKSGLNYYATIAMTVASTMLLGIVVERLVMRPIAATCACCCTAGRRLCSACTPVRSATPHPPSYASRNSSR